MALAVTCRDLLVVVTDANEAVIELNPATIS
jgi:hypothetical protein